MKLLLPKLAAAGSPSKAACMSVESILRRVGNFSMIRPAILSASSCIQRRVSLEPMSGLREICVHEQKKYKQNKTDILDIDFEYGGGI